MKYIENGTHQVNWTQGRMSECRKVRGETGQVIDMDKLVKLEFSIDIHLEKLLLK